MPFPLSLPPFSFYLFSCNTQRIHKVPHRSFLYYLSSTCTVAVPSIIGLFWSRRNHLLYINSSSFMQGGKHDLLADRRRFRQEQTRWNRRNLLRSWLACFIVRCQCNDSVVADFVVWKAKHGVLHTFEGNNLHRCELNQSMKRRICSNSFLSVGAYCHGTCEPDWKDYNRCACGEWRNGRKVGT